jgi:hypothetical protein
MQLNQQPAKKLRLDRMTIAVLENSWCNGHRGVNKANLAEQSTYPACDVTNPTTIMQGGGILMRR